MSWELTFQKNDGTVVTVSDGAWTYLPAARPVEVQSEGTVVANRSRLNFTENVSVPTDDPDNNRINLPVGGGSGVTGYNHTQASASATWTINHNLGRRPVVDVFTVGGQALFAEILHVSVNQAQVLFASPIAGSARCV